MTLAIQALGTLTRVGYVLPEALSIEGWLDIVNSLKDIQGSTMWWVGDALVYGRAHYGEEYTQALGDITDYSTETIRQAEYVAERVERHNRLFPLSWSHHRLVANMDVDAQNYWLTRALEEGWTRKELAAAIKGEDTEEPQLKGRSKEAWEYVQTRVGREWQADDSDHVYAILSGAVDAEGSSGHRVDEYETRPSDLNVEGPPEVQAEMPLDGAGDGAVRGAVPSAAGTGTSGEDAQ